MTTPTPNVRRANDAQLCQDGVVQHPTDPSSTNHEETAMHRDLTITTTNDAIDVAQQAQWAYVAKHTVDTLSWAVNAAALVNDATGGYLAEELDSEATGELFETAGVVLHANPHVG